MTDIGRYMLVLRLERSSNPSKLSDLAMLVDGIAKIGRGMTGIMRAPSSDRGSSVVSCISVSTSLSTSYLSGSPTPSTPCLHSPSSRGLGYVADGSVMPIDRMNVPGKGSLQPLGGHDEAIRKPATIALSWLNHTPERDHNTSFDDAFLDDVTSTLRCLEVNPAPDLLCALWSSVCSRMSVGHEIGGLQLSGLS
ncbi:hypothetical protein BKA70DRAFT_876912 [Coprinopsis sp. MPI-PUGE-AT-0042]|nr:hypothetical protein BKA70DRAFT_876912 [Coprinopsis sp. MPI-PUGE-AT-0042]